MSISCIAIDDEPLALGLIRDFILRTPGLKLLGEFSDAIAALTFIKNNPIDIIFLDIRMPELSGMELAKIIESRSSLDKPRIIFTTAYDSYALDSYKVDALDYLLKPFNYVDFTRAYQKAEAYVSLVKKQAALANAQEQFAAVTENSQWSDPFLYIKVDYQFIKVTKSDILYIESYKDYVKIYMEESAKPILTLATLKSVEERLDPAKFLRVHRSYIVSLDKVTSVTKNSVQIGSSTITITELYKEAFKKFFDRWK